MRRIILHAGDYFFGSPGVHVHTLLGSCISITLWHPTLKVGGICHYALPINPQPCQSRYNPRFASDCFLLFKRSIARHGRPISEYQAKIFGGGNMYEKNDHTFSEYAIVERKTIGEKNVAAATSFLFENQIPLLVAHVGEFGYRKIMFDLATGDVWVKFTPVESAKGNVQSQTGDF
jgi:chemotaxis protein CheD